MIERSGGAGVRTLRWGVRLIAIAGLAAATGATAQRMDGFDVDAARGEVVELRVPGWMNGKVKLGDAEIGRVRRKALGTSETVSLFDVRVGGAERFGSFGFDVDAPLFGGGLVGECIYHRTERRFGTGILDISQPLTPLLLQCRYMREGRQVGRLVLEAAPRTMALIQSTRRIGFAELDGARISIESAHRLRKAIMSSEYPIGYRFGRDNEPVGAIDISGFSKRFVALPTTGPARGVTLAAALTMAVFWDPKDTDD